MSEDPTKAGQEPTNPADGQPDPAKVEGSEPPKTPDPEKPEAGDKPNADDQPSPPKPAEKVVPEKYDLKPPEGSLLDTSAVEKVAAFAKDKGLSNEEAQAVLDRDAMTIKSYADAQMEEFNKQTQKWVEDVKNDKEIGGEAFNQNVELAKRVIHHFAPEDLKKELDNTGFGNHPGLVKMLVKIGKTMSEDQLVMPGAQSGGQRSAEEVFYGKKDS